MVLHQKVLKASSFASQIDRVVAYGGKKVIHYAIYHILHYTSNSKKNVPLFYTIYLLQYPSDLIRVKNLPLFYIY